MSENPISREEERMDEFCRQVAHILRRILTPCSEEDQADADPVQESL